MSQHTQWDIQLDRRGGIRRRQFLRTITAGSLAAGALTWRDLMTVRAEDLRREGRACILLWMQGGPSQMETFDPKPGHANGGETRAISTRVPGIQIASTLPKVASVMDRLCLIRSMNSREGSHPRASYLMHTGYLPTASVKYPELGSIATHQVGDPKSDLPGFVRIGRTRAAAGGGFLGVEHDAFALDDARQMPSNTTVASSEARYRRRLNLLGKLEDDYAAHGGEQEVTNHRKLYGRASRMVLSPKMETFDLQQESASERAAYGDSQFAAGCLMARRLVEAGVTFVEVSLGNWDTHQDNVSRTNDLCGQLDQPYARLIQDLEQRGLLDKTLVVWMGEFGRTPRINPRGGRDHYPRAFNVALAGGGIKGGQVIGSTDPSGASVKDRPVGVSDLLRTICHSMHIDADRENMSGVGRPIKIVDGGEVVKEALG